MDQKAKSFLQLVLRSPDTGDGWRNVSSALWPLVKGFSLPELIETEGDASGGRLRLSERGKIVCDYL